ncbi:sensor histidine kinase [Nesterenkonia haasae]|uniref:sensor histidine kinase n=1 Tax=Nesterenkonia haasae TaxID=2587813 RepID=UPI001390B2FA|nr:histidine kinase [Nesterenkonia haasae]
MMTVDHRRLEEYSGAAILVLCLGIGVLTLLVGVEPFIPVWAWALLLLGCLGSVFLAASGMFARRHQLMLYAAALLSSWALLFTMPHQGMLAVILVVIAAVGSYLLSIPKVLGIVLLNLLALILQQVIHGVDPVESIASTVFYGFIHLAAVFSTYALWRETTLRAELEQKNVELEAAGVLLEHSAKTAERLRIARELHDAIGHQLTVLNLELEAARHRLAARAEVGDVTVHIEQAAEVAKELLADVRATVGELRATEPGDLQAQLERIAGSVPSLEIHVETDAIAAVDDQQGTALVRAAQEIITNTVKHSEARELSLVLTQDASHVILTGTNDGLAPKTVTFGHGLTGLQERVELLGGQLSVTTSPCFTVQVQLPAAGSLSESMLRDEEQASP